MPAHSNQLEASPGGNAVDILAIGAKHSRNLRQTVGGCHNICIQFLILYRAVIGLRSIPSFKALLGHSALAQDIDHIVAVYRQFTAGQLEPGVVEERYAFVATPADIRENDYNLNIPRYVDTFEEEAEVDIPAVQREIDALEKELAQVQAQMNDYLKELGL